MGIIRVTESEFARDPASVGDKAQREPVTITRDGKDRLVVLSAAEYHRLKRYDHRTGLTEDLPDEWIEEVRRAKMPSGLEDLDKELK